MFRLSSSIMRICRGIFLFSLGRGLGSDVFFSLYINQIFNNHIFLVGIVAAIMPIVKMVFSLSIGEIDDHANLKKMIYISKLLYAVCGILFFTAGRLHQPRMLILAISINGIASASLFTTYETHIRSSSKDTESAHNFGWYLSFFHGAHVLGALICALFITKIDAAFGLKSVFLFISILSLVSLFADRHLSAIHDKKQGMIETIKQISFSTKMFRHVRKTLKESNTTTRFFLILEFLYSILNYISFLFIPLLATQRHMGLAEIALLYAIMRMPYMLSIVLARFWERYPQKTAILIVYVLLAVFCFGLGFTENANTIFIWTIGLSFGLAFVRPMILSGISEGFHGHKSGSISGIQESIGMLGCAVGSMGFATLSSFFGMPITFSILGISIITIIIWIGIRMRILFDKTPPTVLTDFPS